MKNELKAQDYKDVEEKFYNQLSKKLGKHLRMYCVCGSLSRDDVIPGWSDIDIIIVIDEYSEQIFQKIEKTIRNNNSKIKIGCTIYQTDEFNYELYNDPKTCIFSQYVIAGVVTPRLLSADIIPTKMSKKNLIIVNRIDLTIQSHLLKRELTKKEISESSVYKLISHILRNILRQNGFPCEGYQNIWENSTKYLPDFTFQIIHPRDIMNSKRGSKQRFNTYIKILNWLTKYRYV